VFGTIAGFFVLGGAKLTPAGIAGVALNTAGGCLYSYCKWQEKASGGKAVAAQGVHGKGGDGGGGAAHRIEVGAAGARRRRDSSG